MRSVMPPQLGIGLRSQVHPARSKHMARRVLIGSTRAGLLALIATATVTACVSSHSDGPPASLNCANVALKAIMVGSQPGHLVITPDGKTAYVVNVNSGTV